MALKVTWLLQTKKQEYFLLPDNQIAENLILIFGF